MMKKMIWRKSRKSLFEEVVDLNRFDSWRKLLRVTGYLFKAFSKENNDEGGVTLGKKLYEKTERSTSTSVLHRKPTCLCFSSYSCRERSKLLLTDLTHFKKFGT